jgi:hypothetical protein
LPEKEITFFAALLHQYGLVTVAYSILLVAVAFSILPLISWLKQTTQRKSDAKLVKILTDLSDEIKLLARQYNESISLPQVEILMENFLKHHCGALNDFIREILEKNDIINQRDSVEANIKMQIYITFKAVDNALAKFKYKTKSLNEFVDRCIWETQMNETVIKTVYDNKLTCAKKISNVRTYLKTEFGNIHFLVMQDVNKY